jgi:hypothetical protein
MGDCVPAYRRREMPEMYEFDDSAWEQLGKPRRGIVVQGSGIEMGNKLIPLDPNTMEKALEISLANKEAVLEWASLKEGVLHKDKPVKGYHPAYLLVTLAPGHKGAIHYYRQGGPEERLIGGHVIRRFVPFPPVGITVLAQYEDPHDGVCQRLLELAPGASFKVCRSGDLEGLPRKFEVRWTGAAWEVRAHPHGKWKPKEAEKVVL